MKVKKCLTLCATSIFTLLSCQNAPIEKTSISLWHYYNSNQEAAFNNLVSEFNQTVGKEKNIVVNASTKGYTNALLQAVTDSIDNKIGASPLPDMFMSYADTAFYADLNGKVAAIEDYFTEEELNEYNAAFIDEGYFDGEHLKIFPIAKATELLFINKTDFDIFVNACPNENITLERLKTIEGLIEVSKIYYDWCGKAFYGRDSLSNYFLISAKQLGSEIMNFDENNDIVLDKNVIKQIYDCYYTPYVKGYFSAESKFRTADISTNKIICYTGSSSSAEFFPDEVIISDNNKYPIEGIAIDSPKFSSSEVEETYAVQQGAGIVVTKTDEKKQQACTEFLKWFTKAENNVKFSIDVSYMPVKKNAISEDEIRNNEELTQVEKDSILTSNVVFNNQTLYTSEPSLKGNSIRTVLDNFLQNSSKNARTQYLEAINKGENTDAFFSEETFEEWYLEFYDAVNINDSSSRIL